MAENQAEMLPSGWQLVSPVPVTTEQDEDGRYIVSDDIPALLVYGEGDTADDALRDYYVSLAELAELVASDVRCGLDARQLNVISVYICPDVSQPE